MNCKAGDLAVCISDGPYKGQLFECISLAPSQGFHLPDGTYHDPPQIHPSWVLKSLGGIMAPFSNGSWKRAKYGVGADRCLRPLPGIPDDVDVESEVTA